MDRKIYEESLAIHETQKGKLHMGSKVGLKSKKDLSLAYTPGVAEPCRRIFANKEDVYRYTNKGNLVAVVTDGSAVLGLGNIGAEAAIPVMEGKAVLFKEFAGIDAFPICVKSQNVDDIVTVVRNIAPVFGGINLEDIKAPECFEVESRLQDLGIPVMHDDQHGTAIVVLAGLLNALKLANKKKEEVRIVINGAGAAGTAIARLLLLGGFKRIVFCDSQGVIYYGRPGLSKAKQEIAELTNQVCKYEPGHKDCIRGDLSNAMEGADVFVGVSKGNLFGPELIAKMNPSPIIFALANPVPEIMPDKALAGGAFIVATGRSDFPNQLNNALAFPGIFRGALDSRADRITNEMKVAAANALAASAVPSPGNILPSVLNKEVHLKVAEAVSKAWTPLAK